MDNNKSKSINWNDIRLVIFDCDGVLTDGKIIYSEDNTELKNFSAHDGMGFFLLNRAGLESAVITGRTSQSLAKRCNDLSIKHVYQGVHKKLQKAMELLEKLNLGWHQVVYVGDDWNDIPVMQRAAFSFCPGDAMPEIQKLADVITLRSAGNGAVREVIDYILYKKGIYEQVVEQFLNEISE